jgi:hypothetical protein
MHGIEGGRPDTQAIVWAQRLGEERHGRDECAARTAKSREEEAERMTAVSIERWAAIVASIRGLVDAYNAGARRVVLSVVEQSGQPVVTVATGGEGTPCLTAALEDTLICIHGRHSGGVAHATEIRLRPDRDDDATAAYVLRDWMQRL